jgi:hypothetical protein
MLAASPIDILVHIITALILLTLCKQFETIVVLNTVIVVWTRDEKRSVNYSLISSKGQALLHHHLNDQNNCNGHFIFHFHYKL